ncbi:hypothetical protein P3T43_000202 [Paraburkholderia sp. GAS41]
MGRPVGAGRGVNHELGKRKVAFIAARESLGDKRLGPQLKAAFGGPYIVNEKFTRESAQQVLASREADAVAWGQLFIANSLSRRRRHESKTGSLIVAWLLPVARTFPIFSMMRFLRCVDSKATLQLCLS